MSFLNSLTQWWSSFYGNHQLVSVFVHFLHLAALVLGAGTALFADRQVFRAARLGPPEREAVLAILDRAHPHVVSWLVVVGSTGILMTAADTSTFLGSTLYWIKMTLVVFLLANGLTMVLAERRARRVSLSAGWPRLVTISTISTILWLAILFLGSLLTVVA
jgi:hypothetical protein